ncbi:hypothetical protein Esi_0036_0098 [Ectocarpus siliculosus]|uniref:Uncharacterized protein n=1 Tax=Ectocarpus siliculosus TaxID=2880 RepID=D8LLD5_ECTSI|nr:hypothetical protein Esi_0036_0098 [Ectocarpus siliculosus]|eukprot:CBN77133.1 hypothetical protein Esi_0036_0098 [Ectocarpus siliculosus]
MWHWESKEHERREARNIEGRGREHKIADQAGEVKTTAVASDGDGDEDDRKQPQERPASSSVATASSVTRGGGGAGGGGASYRSNESRVHRPPLSPPSSKRPFVQALETLERLTHAAGKPHGGVSAGLASASLPSSSSSSRASTATAADITSSLVSPSPSSLGSTREEGASSGKRKRKQAQERQSAAAAAIALSANDGEGGGGEGGREGGETSSPSSLPGGAAKCRVGFGMIRLLTGPEGNDAGGRPVGVKPGEDVETAVLGSGGSKVSQWVMGRLKIDTRGGERQENGRDNADGNQQYLCLDETHVSGAVCISGTR